MKKLLSSTTFVAALLSVISVAHADSYDYLAKDRFQVRLRAIDVIPDEDTSVSIGGEVDVGNRLAPEIDLTYFFTDNIAAELIAATTKHELKHSSGADLGSAWILPPTLTLQYHFMPKSAFSPYVGAGVNYSMFYGENDGDIADLEVDGGFGVAAQAGFDYWVNENWGVNLDVKKLWLNVDASLAGGAVKADVDLDPWIVGTGISYRF